MVYRWLNNTIQLCYRYLGSSRLNKKETLNRQHWLRSSVPGLNTRLNFASRPQRSASRLNRGERTKDLARHQ